MNNTTPELVEPPTKQLKRWQGIGFSLHGLHYVVAADSVTEIIPLPKTTALPGAKPWIKGLANVSGHLVAIINLGGVISSVDHCSPDGRVLVIPHHELAIGLMVDEVTGIKQFATGKYAEHIPASVPHSMRPFIQGTYDTHNIIFSVARFLDSEQFLTADAGF